MSSRARSTAYERRKSKHLHKLLACSTSSTLDTRTAEEITEQGNKYYIEYYGPEILAEEERCRELRGQAAQEGNILALAKRQDLPPLAAALQHAATLVPAETQR